MTQSHTPTPWAVTSSLGDIHSQARNGENWVHVALPNCPSVPDIEEQIANAAFIVKAVNNHESLFAALKSAKWMLERDFIDPQKLEIIRKCDAAIESVTGDA